MRRLIIGSLTALALAVGLTVGPSIAVPETSTKAEAASNVAYINYGPWLCKAATGYWAKPARIQVDVSPPGLTRVNVNNSWAKVNVHLNVQSTVVAEIHCPHPIAALRFWGITQHVGPISGVRVFRKSGESHWF
jgi:hypothetical protein